ncbi:hypothetical protein FOA52_008980 [Chlamydomonas sp. UWO 241]|nr:hypothetical protein FOA52_008980 [Chlamydomonas sp. UWO 241]
MAAEGQVVRVPWLCRYSDFVRVSKAIMANGRSIVGQELLIRRALNSIIPFGSGLFRTLLGKTGGYTKWCHELNALAASLMFKWLVGDMELHSTEVLGPDGILRTQTSVTHIKKCRFLDQSGCVSACTNLCKAPTQAFFTLEAGIPTTLEPDFATRSCNIVFGRTPPPRAEDPAFTEPCFAVKCSLLAPDGERRVAAGHRAAVLAMPRGELPPLPPRPLPQLPQQHPEASAVGDGAAPGSAAPPDVAAPAPAQR